MIAMFVEETSDHLKLFKNSAVYQSQFDTQIDEVYEKGYAGFTRSQDLLDKLQ